MHRHDVPICIIPSTLTKRKYDIINTHLYIYLHDTICLIDTYKHNRTLFKINKRV